MSAVLWVAAALVILAAASWPADRYLSARRDRRREAARRRLDAWLTERHGFAEADLTAYLEAHRAGAQALARALDEATLHGTSPAPALGEATVIEGAGYPPRPSSIAPATVTLELAALERAVHRHPAGRRLAADVVELEPRRQA